MASKQPKTTTTKTVDNLSSPSSRLVIVEWHDAAVSIGWDEGQSDAKIEQVSSVGWLLAKGDTEVVLGADISTAAEGVLHTNRRIAIPASWIKSIKDIKA
jgi:hypothetical protein